MESEVERKGVCDLGPEIDEGHRQVLCVILSRAGVTIRMSVLWEQEFGHSFGDLPL